MKEEEIDNIYEVCDMLLLTKEEVSIKKYRAELAIMMSCTHQGQSLDDYSARDLIYQSVPRDNPYNCSSWSSGLGQLHQVGYGKDVPTHSGKSTPAYGIGQVLIKQ